MPQLSPRITQLNEGGSDGWEVFYRARAMVAAGTDVTELTIGEHDIRTAPAILDAMHEAAHGGHTGYAMVPGIPALRAALAQRLTERTGVPTTAENILVTPGGQAGLFSAHMAVLDPGDAALYVDPYYATYPGTIRAASGRAVPVQTRARDAFLPDPAAVSEAAAESGAKSLLINTPNNPTGTIYPQATLEALAEVCRDRDLWLISDEVYDTQLWEGAHLSPRTLPGMAERTMVIGSMSKSHAMTGSRIGWIVAPAPAIERLIDLATATTYGVPGYIQDAALFALTRGPDLEERIAAPFRRRRALALEVIARQDTVTAIPSQGAMYLMLDIRATGLSGRDFADRLLDAHHIAVMPGESFGRSAAGHVRVALTVDDARLDAALGTLCAFAESLTHE
ncbi:pyridoxal phosphate-dependent aminotransferase [Pseudoponticoccus marisrubri]|uniref:Aminotransferase n=1 Tax=Pseudoponticoccus marisrubri TaxID=1685382 RepID=A0A0W7WMW6_9RHOB|nr:pyridoxal phosphate-dependent aminotransferase [Pseudoponticoccus marisrubri]KUF11945.1 aspartate aminotransferase [Pseudoponticoccus marisrubri]